MTEPDDLQRLRIEYAEREKRPHKQEIYSHTNQANLFILQQRARSVLHLSGKAGIHSFTGLNLLEVGCGRGGVLLEYLGWGAMPDRLHGCDLLLDRVQDAHRTLPHLPLACADGQNLPYPSHSFDLALQYTAFSSILDPVIKVNLAREMLRVLRRAVVRLLAQPNQPADARHPPGGNSIAVSKLPLSLPQNYPGAAAGAAHCASFLGTGLFPRKSESLQQPLPGADPPNQAD